MNMKHTDDAARDLAAARRQLIARLPIEDRLEGLTLEQVLACFTPEQLLASLTPERCVAGRTLDEIIAAIPPDKMELLLRAA